MAYLTFEEMYPGGILCECGKEIKSFEEIGQRMTDDTVTEVMEGVSDLIPAFILICKKCEENNV